MKTPNNNGPNLVEAYFSNSHIGISQPGAGLLAAN